MGSAGSLLDALSNSKFDSDFLENIDESLRNPEAHRLTADIARVKRSPPQKSRRENDELPHH